MARVEVPVVVTTTDAQGKLVRVSGATVTVNIRGGGLATVYAASTGGTTTPNPLTSDADGRVEGWVERGAYDVLVTGIGLSPYTHRFDAAPAGDGSIDTAWLTDASITAPKLASSAVTSTAIAAGAVTSAKMATDSVGSTAIAANAVTSTKIQDGAVTTSKILDQAVTAAKLAPGVTPGTGVIIPAGAIFPFAGNIVPDGFLLCYGQAVSRSTYSSLWTAIGITYGAGNGSTTFNLPDFRGAVLCGIDSMGGSSKNKITDPVADTLGGALGSESTVLVTGNLPSHQHTISGTGSTHDHTLNDPQHAHTLTGSTDSTNIGFNDPGHGHSGSFTTGINTGSLNAGSTNHRTQTGSAFVQNFTAGAASTGISFSNANHSHPISSGSTSNVSTGITVNSGSGTHTHGGNTGLTGSGTGFTNLQPTMFLNFIIAY